MWLQAAGWFLHVLLRFVVFTSKLLCVSLSSLSCPSLLHQFPQRRDLSERSEASKKNIWLHQLTAPCCGTVLMWGSTSTFHENPAMRSPPQHFLPNRMLRYKLLLQKLQYEHVVIDELITGDIKGSCPGLWRCETGVNMEHQRRTDCSWRRLPTHLILLEETGRKEQNPAIVIISLHSYIGFPVTTLAFGQSWVENLMWFQSAVPGSALREQFDKSVLLLPYLPATASKTQISIRQLWIRLNNLILCHWSRLGLIPSLNEEQNPNSPPEDAGELLGRNFKAAQARCGRLKPPVLSHREQRMGPLTKAPEGAPSHPSHELT